MRMSPWLWASSRQKGDDLILYEKQQNAAESISKQMIDGRLQEDSTMMGLFQFSLLYCSFIVLYKYEFSDFSFSKRSISHSMCPCYKNELYNMCTFQNIRSFTRRQVCLAASKNIECSNPFVFFLSLYIAQNSILYYSNLYIIDSWERTVHCLFCNSMATLKSTKTKRIMLRCNVCGSLVFANRILSQQRIMTLKDFRFTPVRQPSMM